MEPEHTENRTDALSGEVLTLARNTLLVNLRFLDAALSQFSPEIKPGGSLATDGSSLYYDPLHILRSYRAEHAAPARDYLHLVLHCVFRHMYTRKKVDPDLWDLACDIAVEHAITGFGLNAVTVEREQKQGMIIDRLRREIGMLTAEKIYRRLEAKPYWLEEFEELYTVFRADDHSPWYTLSPESFPAQESESFWKDVSQRMQVDMETFARRQGDKARAMMENLREVNRVAYDYTGFLQKFASRGEVMKSDPDEFDYIFYTYGMQLYKNVPLIEPLEYKNVKTVRDFVIAVDLTGLVEPDQARRFLRKAYEVIKGTESPASTVRIHILTCNGASVEPLQLKCTEDLDTYLNGLRRRFTEETDFRPAFLWMDEMLHKNHFRNLKGFLYFTDGYGPFPPKKPDHEAAFVFVNDNYSIPDVPPWAVRLVLQKDELNEYEQS